MASEGVNEPMLTYRDIKSYLDSLTEEQLNQEAMVVYGSNHDPIPLCPVYCIGDVNSLFDDSLTRSSKDNLHHPEQIVICVDYHPYSKDGDIYYELQEDLSLKGNHTGKLRGMANPS